MFGSPESTEEEYHDGPLSEVFGSSEWRQTDNVEMPMFSLSEVPSAAPATGGTVFLTASVGGAARAPASDDGTVALTAASATGGTVPSAASFGGAPASWIFFFFFLPRFFYGIRTCKRTRKFYCAHCDFVMNIPW